MSPRISYGRLIVLTFIFSAAVAPPRSEAAQITTTWLGGGGTWNTPAQWSGGVVPNNGADTYNARIDNGNATVSAVSLDISPIVDNLAISTGDSLTISNGITFAVSGVPGAGTITNAGTITLGSAGPAIFMPRNGAVTLTGGGTFTMTDDINNFVYGLSPSDRLINVNNTIQGAGQLGDGFMALTNQGLIVANASTNPLIIDPNPTDGVINTGTLRATSGGVLRLLNPVTNTGGTIEALNASRVELYSATITGGTLTTAGTGLVRVINQSSLDGTVHTVTNAGVFEIPTGQICTIYGTIANTGTISIKGGSSVLRPGGGTVMLTGGGTVTLADDLNSFIYGVNPSDRLINVNNTIQGAGQLGDNFLAITNQSLIVANAANNPLIINPNDTDGVTNTATLRAAGGGVLGLQAGPFTNTGGVIEALNGSRVEIYLATIIGGTMSTTGTGLIRVTAQSTLDGTVHTVTNSGAFEVAPGAFPCDLLGTISNTGTITLRGGGALLRSGGGTVNLTGGGTVTMTDDATNQIYGVVATDRLINVNNTIQGAGQIGENFMSLTNQGTINANGANPININVTDAGDFTNQGSLQATGPGGINMATGPFTTSGSVTVAPGSQLSRTGNFTQTAGTTTVNGTLTASGIVDIQGGILKGSGNISADVTNAGSVQPGNSAGVLHVTGNYIQTLAGETSIEIGGNTLGTQYDRLSITGTANLNGTLRVSLINGFIPSAGNSFTIMTYSAATGNFSNLVLPCSPGGHLLRVDMTDTAVVVTALPATGGGPGLMLGDMDCDCVLTVADIDAFTLALLDPAAFAIAHPGCNINSGDMDQNGKVDGRDIAPFIRLFVP